MGTFILIRNNRLVDCDLVKHKNNLSDNVPFKEPYRRVPPALFQEIRDHLTELLQAGTIKQSHSPYSLNIVKVKKMMDPSDFVLILGN